MREHRAQLRQRQQPQQPLRAAHGRRPGAVPDGEDVRLRSRGHEQPRHRQVRGEGELPDDPVQVGALYLADGTRAERGEHCAFRVEVNDPAEGDEQRDDF